MKYIISLLFIVTFFFLEAGTKLNTIKSKLDEGNIFIISVGIDTYEEPFYRLKNSAKDSKALVDKIVNDNPHRTHKDIQDYINQHGRGSGEGNAIDSTFTFLLNNENANLDSIKEAFSMVASLATPYDYFIFYFGGVSIELTETETVLIPFLDESFDSIEEIPPNQLLTLNELARMMELIQCENQLIISEAGMGSVFAKNLMSELFESNPLIAIGTDRNRIIITTKSYGFDNCICEDSVINHGPLTYFILNSGNILNAFKHIDNYEFDLVKSEIECNILQNKKYVAIYEERYFRNIFISNYQKSLSRGPKTVISSKKQKKVQDKEVKIYGLIVATNEYRDQTEWGNLDNPIVDAEEVSSILETKYNVEIHKLYNKPKDSLLMEILKLRSIMDTTDKFFLFIAGHGYYSNDWADGYLVFSDSKSLSDDFNLNSYLNMAKLERMLDHMPSKNLFVVFDVCFGASFNLNSKDLTLNDYQKLEMDISIDTLDKRKSKYKSRIFLASGRYEVPDYWNNSRNHSPFAAKLIASLKEEDSFITPGKIYDRLEGNATEPFLKYFGMHESRADFILKVDIATSTR